MSDYLRYKHEYEELFGVTFAEDDPEFPKWLAGKAAGYEVMVSRQQAEIDNYIASVGNMATLAREQTAEIAALQVETENRRLDIERQQAEITRLNSLFESLTPGGSEFHNDPDRCYEFARERMGTLAKQQAEITRLWEAAKAALPHIDHDEDCALELGEDYCSCPYYRIRDQLRAALHPQP